MTACFNTADKAPQVVREELQQMRWPSFSKTEYAVLIVVITAAVVIVGPPLLPRPHWKETISESCHLCGNRRVTIQQYRWWRLHAEREEFATNYTIPEAHTHDWWQYSQAYVSWSLKWAADKSSKYRDGSISWKP